MTQQLLDMGCYEVSLGDTTGEGNPVAWDSLWTALTTAGIGSDKLAVSPNSCADGHRR